jgi:hypothetical protein
MYILFRTISNAMNISCALSVFTKIKKVHVTCSHLKFIHATLDRTLEDKDSETDDSRAKEI